MKMFRSFVAACAAIAVLAGPSLGASIPFLNGTTAVFPADIPDINSTIQQINQGITPQSIASFNATRNVVDNGAMSVAQRSLATTAAVGAINGAACTSVTYFADRWCVDTNVASGAGFGKVITASPSPPLGFKQSMEIYRNTGALTQPVCAIQEIQAGDSIHLQGQQVTLSYYAQALSGLNADNGSVINAYVISGTGSDEGLGTWTASPAITPAWTGIASTGGTAQTITTTWVRYQFTVQLPAAATELGVELCFTPTATGAGTTDGFAFTGVQLEQGSVASTFAFLPFGLELAKAQGFYLEYADAAATRSFPATCTEITANTTSSCTWVFPATMRAIPATAVLTSASFGITKTADGTAATCTALAAIATSNTVQSGGLTCAATQTAAVGTMGRLIGAASGATNTITFSADF